MKAVLLANVGSRDVQVDGMANLPKDSHTLGEMILQDFKTYAPFLRYPILVKALEATLKSHGGRLDRIVLFATDQSDARYRHTNTLPFAQIILQHLRDRFDDKGDPWIDQATEIVIIRENPADYDQMMTFYEDTLMHMPVSDKMYLAVTGGTPAMSFMLLWQGVQHFGAKAMPLYVTQERPVPSFLVIGSTLVTRAVEQDFAASLAAYEYGASGRLLRQNAELLEPAWGAARYRAICALVQYAAERFNFNFDAAHGALFGAELGLKSSAATWLRQLIDDLANRDEPWLLGEELLGVELDFERAAYKDAVSNIFAFRESILRQIALAAGCRLDAGGRKLDPRWIDETSGLGDYLESKNIDVSRSVTTFVYEMVLEYLRKGRLLDDHHAGLLTQIDKLKPLSELRNTSTHRHGGVSRELVESTYRAPLEQIVRDLRTLYESFTSSPVTPRDFRHINQLLTMLIEDSP